MFNHASLCWQHDAASGSHVHGTFGMAGDSLSICLLVCQGGCLCCACLAAAPHKD